MPDKPYDPGDDLTVLVSSVECCVCGRMMYGLTAADWPHLFQVDQIVDKRTGKPMNLYCHRDPCKEIVNDAGRYRDWKRLPPGPLRKKYEEYYLEKAKGKIVK